MKRKPKAAGLAGVIAGVLTGIAFLAFTREGIPPCGPVHELAWLLDLQEPGGRAHLDDDLRAIRQQAALFSAAIARRPVGSDSPDALESMKTAPMRARAWCEATLTEWAARAHGVRIQDVREALVAVSDAE